MHNSLRGLTGRNDRLLTGQKFFSMSSSPIFFTKGLIMAVFQCSMKIPCISERLINFVSAGRISCKLSLSNAVGIGSSSQFFLAGTFTIFSASSSVIAENSLKGFCLSSLPGLYIGKLPN